MVQHQINKEMCFQPLYIRVRELMCDQYERRVHLGYRGISVLVWPITIGVEIDVQRFCY
jgi:hypothetical protein